MLPLRTADRSPARPAESRWEIRPFDSALSQRLAREYSLHPAAARVLAGRAAFAGNGGLPAYLSPMLRHLRSPFELADMEPATDRVLRALRDGEKVCIYGDYDVDGLSATAILEETLRRLGGDPAVVIPHRFNEGYGMNTARVEQIAASGTTLIVTVDNGISALEPVRRARELGLDVVVTDHHLPSEEGLPDAAAIVNPNRPDAAYEHGRLCGAGVAFKFAHALLKAAGEPERRAKPFLLGLLDLVALGTVADMVPLLGENRVLARHGLEALAKTKRPGLVALLRAAGHRNRSVSPYTVGFVLGPRLNAAGRCGDAMPALRLLLTRDPEEATRLAGQLEQLNRERRRIEEDILTASLQEADRTLAGSTGHTLVVGGRGWHLGVVGIVAARLTERYEVPAIVLGIDDEGVAKGSARSIPGFDIHEALIACAEHLETYGGHAGAAGLRLRADALPDFRGAINEYAGGIFSGLDRTRVVVADTELRPREIGWDLHGALERMQPFGEGNPSPRFLLRGVRAVYPPRIVGKNHLRLRAGAGNGQWDAIGFSRAHLKELFESDAPNDIIVHLQVNEFNGQRRLEFELLDARPSV